MLLAALVFAGCQLLVFGGSLFLLRRWYENERERLRQDAENAVRSFVEAPNADTPSPLAAMVDQFAMLLAARLMQQVKSMLAGVESGAAKGEQLAMMDTAMAESPWLAMIGAMLPKRIRNSLMKNPQMVAALSKLGHNHSGAGDGSQPRLRYRD
jgi:hypothetical protein